MEGNWPSDVIFDFTKISFLEIANVDNSETFRCLAIALASADSALMITSVFNTDRDGQFGEGYSLFFEKHIDDYEDYFLNMLQCNGLSGGGRPMTWNSLETHGFLSIGGKGPYVDSRERRPNTVGTDFFAKSVFPGILEVTKLESR